MNDTPHEMQLTYTIWDDGIWLECSCGHKENLGFPVWEGTDQHHVRLAGPGCGKAMEGDSREGGYLRCRSCAAQWSIGRTPSGVVAEGIAEDIAESLADALGVDDEDLRGLPEWASIASGCVALQRLATSHEIEVSVVVERPYERGDWEGDLMDDCSLRRDGLAAHCEHLSPGCWYASVYVPGSGTDLYHSGEAGMGFATGGDARRFCEWFILNFGSKL